MTKAKITITGDDVFKDALSDWIKDALEQAAQDQEEWEHNSGDMVPIDEITFVGNVITVTLQEPETEEEEGEEESDDAE